LWPQAQALRLCVVVVREADGRLGALATQPDDDLLRQAVSLRVRQPLAWTRVDDATLRHWLEQGERAYAAIDELTALAADEAAAPDADLSIQSISAQSSPVVRLLDATLFDGLKAQASDLHLESRPQGVTIRYRLDGVMEPVSEVAGREMAEQLVSRLKIVAGLDIGERRLPQDGRFKRRVGSGEDARDVDFRVSIMPTSFGEDAVVRILDRGRLAEQHAGLTLDSLGFDAEDVAQILQLARKPYGMLLVTGPTGSGKTTTLYATIAHTRDEGDKLITIEDPVEYQLPGVIQIPVNEKKGLTFARGLRSILRHDPDKIMVGEIRDTETAQIASQAALTGHLVLTTVHANNAIDVIGRFMHMGLDLYNIVSCLNGVVAQRLLRRLCGHCARPCEPEAAQLASAGIAAKTRGRFLRPVGCPACRGTGYRGRRAIAEVLVLDDALRDMIVARQPLSAIKAHARAGGARALREAALACVLSGETSLEELDRVTQVD
jgi:general secretion pathway protein E